MGPPRMVMIRRQWLVMKSQAILKPLRTRSQPFFIASNNLPTMLRKVSLYL